MLRAFGHALPTLKSSQVGYERNADAAFSTKSCLTIQRRIAAAVVAIYKTANRSFSIRSNSGATIMILRARLMVRYQAADYLVGIGSCEQTWATLVR